jgi:hypothetical protein
MLALTCKAAFEAYEASDCKRLEALVSTLQGVIAQGQERELVLTESTVFLLATCDLYAERFV